MYNLVIESSIFFKELIKEDLYRRGLVEPILLLKDTRIFLEAKENRSTTYENLCEIISQMKNLYNSGDENYHPFANFLREVEDEGFEIDAMNRMNITEENKLKDQIELIRMFMSFKYCSK